MSELAPNTPEQVAAHEAHEAKAADELTWPIYHVEIAGDNVEWVNRPGQHWQDDGTGNWVPKAIEDLPEGVTIGPNGNIQLPAYAQVALHAKNEDHAKALALSANPDYHTILSVKQLNIED